MYRSRNVQTNYSNIVSPNKTSSQTRNTDLKHKYDIIQRLPLASRDKKSISKEKCRPNLNFPSKQSEKSVEFSKISQIKASTYDYQIPAAYLSRGKCSGQMTKQLKDCLKHSRNKLANNTTLKLYGKPIQKPRETASFTQHKQQNKGLNMAKYFIPSLKAEIDKINEINKLLNANKSLIERDIGEGKNSSKNTKYKIPDRMCQTERKNAISVSTLAGTEPEIIDSANSLYMSTELINKYGNLLSTHETLDYIQNTKSIAIEKGEPNRLQIINIQEENLGNNKEIHIADRREISSKLEESTSIDESRKEDEKHWKENYMTELEKNDDLVNANRELEKLKELLRMKDEQINTLQIKKIISIEEMKRQLNSELETKIKKLEKSKENITFENEEKLFNQKQMYEKELSNFKENFSRQNSLLEEKIKECRDLEKAKSEFDEIKSKYEQKLERIRKDRWKLISEKEIITTGTKEALTDLEMNLLTMNSQLGIKGKEIINLREELKLSKALNIKLTQTNKKLEKRTKDKNNKSNIQFSDFIWISLKIIIVISVILLFVILGPTILIFLI